MDSIKLKRIIENNIPRRIDILITVFILAFAFFISLCFVDTGGEDYYASNIFLLAITVISVLTRGYLCGLLSALIGVIAVNYAFT